MAKRGGLNRGFCFRGFKGAFLKCHKSLWLMLNMIQILANGMILGLTFSLSALGFAVVFVPNNVFYVAYGAIYAAVPYITMYGIKSGLPSGGAWLVSILAAICLSLTMELLNHYPLTRRKASPAAHLISSLGIYIVGVQIVALLWGDDILSLSTEMDELLTTGFILITKNQAAGACAAFIMLAVFYVWLQLTRNGLILRAMADNQKEFVLQGYNLRRFRLLSFALSGLLCSGTALISAYDNGFDPYGGLEMVLYAVVAMIIGGRHSFYGPLVGGIVLGLLHGIIVWLLAPSWEPLFTFLALALFLFLRPNGIIAATKTLEPVQS